MLPQGIVVVEVAASDHGVGEMDHNRILISKSHMMSLGGNVSKSPGAITTSCEKSSSYTTCDLSDSNPNPS